MRKNAWLQAKNQCLEDVELRTGTTAAAESYRRADELEEYMRSEESNCARGLRATRSLFSPPERPRLVLISASRVRRFLGSGWRFRCSRSQHAKLRWRPDAAPNLCCTYLSHGSMTFVTLSRRYRPPTIRRSANSRTRSAICIRTYNPLLRLAARDRKRKIRVGGST